MVRLWVIVMACVAVIGLGGCSGAVDEGGPCEGACAGHGFLPLVWNDTMPAPEGASEKSISD